MRALLLLVPAVVVASGCAEPPAPSDTFPRAVASRDSTLPVHDVPILQTTMNGRVVSYVIRSDRAAFLPTWSLEIGEPPPVSALEAASVALSTFEGTAKPGLWAVHSISLTRRGHPADSLSFWYYSVNLGRSSGSNERGEVIVLMDGTVVQPRAGGI